jgi:hypothetical protein
MSLDISTFCKVIVGLVSSKFKAANLFFAEGFNIVPLEDYTHGLCLIIFQIT